jgi:DNA-binding response OmpR family regulator
MNIVLIEPNSELSIKIESKLKIKNIVLKSVISLNNDFLTLRSDIILLSTDFSEHSIVDFIKKHIGKKIILLVDDFYNDNVQKFLDLGVDEYICKPFKIKYLMKKINLLTLQKKLDTYESYYKYISETNPPIISDSDKIKPSRLFVTNNICSLDKAVLEYSLKENQVYKFISCTSDIWEEELNSCKSDEGIYLSNIQVLSRYHRAKISNQLKRRRNVILASTEYVNMDYPVVKLEYKDMYYDGSYIIGHEEYIKYVLEKFQDQMTTTALSEKLQLSRKTIYDKRKKYNLHKNTDKRLVS